MFLSAGLHYGRNYFIEHQQRTRHESVQDHHIATSVISPGNNHRQTAFRYDNHQTVRVREEEFTSCVLQYSRDDGYSAFRLADMAEIRL